MYIERSFKENVNFSGLSQMTKQVGCAQDVAQVVTGLPLKYHMEVEYVQAEYVIDMALPDIRLAIEADGPRHFMRNVPKANGRTLGQ